MTVSDILISKPGGMTSTEALVKRLLMIIVHPLPGQEEKNSQFLVNSGAAIRPKDEREIVHTVTKLLHNRIWLGRLQQSMDELVIHHSSRRIIDAVLLKFTSSAERDVIYA